MLPGRGIRIEVALCEDNLTFEIVNAGQFLGRRLTDAELWERMRRWPAGSNEAVLVSHQRLQRVPEDKEVKLLTSFADNMAGEPLYLYLVSPKDPGL